MKHMAIAILLFCTLAITLILGARGGFSFFPSDPIGGDMSVAAEALTIPNTSAMPVAALPDNQRAFLVIGADDLNASAPRLESVWLVRYTAPDTRLTLSPIYPAVPHNSEKDGLLEKTFSLSSDGSSLRLNQTFLKVINSRRIAWNSYLILDRAAQAEILDAMNTKAGSTLQGMDGKFLVSTLDTALTDPEQSVVRQANLYKEMCYRAGLLAGQADLVAVKELLDAIQGHSISSLEPAQSLQEIRMFVDSDSGVSCMFNSPPVNSQPVQ